MQHAIRKSNAGFVLWGDIYELKALWTFIHRVAKESPLFKFEDPLLLGLAYEIRHAFDGMRHKDTRVWHGDDPTPIYGFDCIWPIILMQTALLRVGLAFMPNLNRNDQAVMYQMEHTVLDCLGTMLGGDTEEFYNAALMVAHAGGEKVNAIIHSRTIYFLLLSPAKRKKEFGAILDSLLPVFAFNNPLTSEVFEPFTNHSDYPRYKW